MFIFWKNWRHKKVLLTHFYLFQRYYEKLIKKVFCWPLLLKKMSSACNISGGFFTTSKTDHHLLRQKVCQGISVMKTNTCFQRIGILIHVLSWRQQKTPVFLFITEILWGTCWRNKWQFVFDVVKNLRYSIKPIHVKWS